MKEVTLSKFHYLPATCRRSKERYSGPLVHTNVANTQCTILQHASICRRVSKTQLL